MEPRKANENRGTALFLLMLIFVWHKITQLQESCLGLTGLLGLV